jgi:hypothetical protein
MCNVTTTIYKQIKRNIATTLYKMGPLGMWWGRWDLNPGSHTPQACILNHARRRPHNRLLKGITTHWRALSIIKFSETRNVFIGGSNGSWASVKNW